jgi:opacity protein-like surface antigen
VGIDQNKVGGSTATVGGTSVAHLTGSSKDQFAWQAMTGLSWYVTPTLALDVGYRFFYGGRTESGFSAGLQVRGDYGAHEVLAGLRWGF